MTSTKTCRATAAAALLAVALTAFGPAPASAAGSTSSGTASSGESGGGGIYGWGPRFGLASDPDQILLGLHLDAGRIAPRVRFQPDVELGVGDNHTIFAFTLPAHYLFRTRTSVGPYLGGGVTIGLDDRDGARNDSDTEIGIVFAGGLEWRTARHDKFFVEVNLIAGDLHDFELVGGFTFR